MIRKRTIGEKYLWVTYLKEDVYPDRGGGRQ